MEGKSVRAYWLETMLKIAKPVLQALSEGRLRESMSLESAPGVTDRAECTYLEALGRTLAGIAPWLECKTLSGAEESQRQYMLRLTRKAIRMAVDPTSPDVMNFSRGTQCIVDAAFLAQGLLRAPTELWEALSADTKIMLIDRLKETRTRKPWPNNWLLFSGVIEAFLHHACVADWDPMRVDYALRAHESWYRGDGIYSDGEPVHADYYNSFVIHPMLMDILSEVHSLYGEWDDMLESEKLRASRFVAILERLVSPEGTYPVIGRSSAYRFGAFHALAQASLLGILPQGLEAGRVRSAMNAVLTRVMSHKEMFDEKGFLRIGLCGAQPSIGEEYISTGSLYLCTTFFLPLGLCEREPFWSEEPQRWTQARIWASEDVAADHSI